MRFIPLLAVLVLACCGCNRKSFVPKEPVDPQQVLDEAQALADQGQFEEALQRHIWFHENALKYDPALSAVRLSFALGYWANLAEKYPKAKKALIGIRDRGDRSLRDGPRSWEQFEEVAAINETLNERAKTVELFKALHGIDPGFAKLAYIAAEKDLAAEREYGLCAQYIPDPQARFRRIREMREVDLKLAQGEHGPRHRKIAEQMFADQTCRLLAILVGAGRKPDAEKVRDQAFAVRNDRPFREAVEKALRGEWESKP